MKEPAFAELEAKYRYLLHHYAYQRIPGMDAEDIMQELRLVLWNCQKHYAAGTMRAGQIKPASFKSYLIRALKNKMQKLHRQYRAKKRGGVLMSDELCMKPAENLSLDAEEVDCMDHRDLLEEAEYLAGLSGKAKAIASFALEGRVDKKDWAALGIAEEELKEVRAEIKALLT